MTFRLQVDIKQCSGHVDHLSLTVILRQWDKAAAMAELKHRYPSALAIKILSHTP